MYYDAKLLHHVHTWDAKNVKKSKALKNEKNCWQGRKCYPLDEENPPGGHNDSKNHIPLLEKRVGL